MHRILYAAAMLCLAAGRPAHAADLVDQARAEIGKTAAQLNLPRSLWCADFINKLLARPHASRRARDYATFGSPAAAGCVGCIAVLARGKSKSRGHVGVVEAWHGANPVVISGNHNGTVGVAEYPRRRLVALREP